MRTVLGIDPGNFESGWALVDLDTCKPLRFGITANDELHAMLRSGDLSGDLCAIEMIASYGMAVGAEVFDTCVWIGKFSEVLRARTGTWPKLVKRIPVKVHHCHTPQAKDANVKQALRNRFAPGVRNYGKGTKDNPGFFHGFVDDAWQAYALAVYVADTEGPLLAWLDQQR